MTQFLRKREVAARVGYHPVHVMRLVKAGRFPRPVRIGPNAIRFVEDEVEAWQKDRIAERDRQGEEVVQ